MLMMRELMDHKWNTQDGKHLKSEGKFFARLAVRVDGEEQAFAAWSEKSFEEAGKRVMTYLDPHCTCVRGSHPMCRVHKSEIN